MSTTKEIRLTLTVRWPRIPKINVTSESDKELKKRILTLHQKFTLQRKVIESKFKSGKLDVSKYHQQLFQLSQDQFAYGIFVSWRRFYVTVEGERKFVFMIGPF